MGDEKFEPYISFLEIPKGAKELSHKPHGRKQNYDEIKEHFFVTKSFLDFRKQLFYFHFYRILSEVDLLKTPFFIISCVNVENFK